MIRIIGVISIRIIIPLRLEILARQKLGARKIEHGDAVLVCVGVVGVELFSGGG